MPASKRRRRTALLVLAGLSLAAVGGTVAAYGYYTLDWGCPSSEELERPIAPEKVVDAFAEGGLSLDLARLPVALPVGARAYHHETEDASLFVVVCDDLCSGEGPDRLPDLSTVEFPAGGVRRDRCAPESAS